MNSVRTLKSIYRHYYHRIPLTIALLIIILVPIFLFLHQTDFANKLAMISFFFLAFGLVWRVTSAIKTKDEKQGLTNL